MLVGISCSIFAKMNNSVTGTNESVINALFSSLEIHTIANNLYTIMMNIKSMNLQVCYSCFHQCA